MQEFEIENNIPIPQPKRKAIYPFKEMEVGQSFVAPEAEAMRVQSAASSYGKISGKQFTARKQPNGDIRIWRKV